MTYEPIVIERAATKWGVSRDAAARLLDAQEARILDRSEGEFGFWQQTDDGPIWRGAVDTTPTPA